jgi:orotate phosphoribosyltransferase
MTWQCQCEASGDCPILKRRMTPRQHAICAHQVLTPEQCDHYVAAWLGPALAGEDPTLLGNRIATLAQKLGIPHCGGCEDRRVLLNRMDRWMRGEKEPADKLRFVTTQQLAADVLLLASQLPHKLAGVVGVARSGLLPANLLAMLLHLPLFALREDTADVIPVGHGWRLGKLPDQAAPLLIVDDTVMSGTSLSKSKGIARRCLADRKLLWSAIYVNPGARLKPDVWVHDLALHFLEWNLFNSVHLPQLALDFDGILTHDGTDRPLYLPRKGEVPLIVTGRSQAHRVGSMAWLTKHGVRVKRMVMFPGETPRDPLVIARYKAQHWGPSGLAYFVESDPIQAKEIARLVGRPVICPAAGEVF